MLAFYKKAALTIFGLLAITLVLGAFCLNRIFVSHALFPAQESPLPWKLETITDVNRGGSSSVSIAEDVYSLDYEYHLTEDIMFPYVITVVAFAELENAEELVDLSKYSTATFKIKCSEPNVLTFYVHNFDERVTDPADFDTYRVASALFSCHEAWSDIEIDLKHLKVPEWWLRQEKLDAADQRYWLNKVVAIAFDASRAGPVSTPVKVKISGLTLHGRDWRYLWLFAGVSLIFWGGYLRWLFKLYISSLIEDVKSKLKKDRSLIAYQQLSIEPHKDEKKSRVLRFMATEYANPDMSLELATATLGITRTKIKKVLKDELDLTFSGYLNKLRLAEAARLLSHQKDANVAEIAYSVGYNNVTYFNKLFKQEYGYTPRTFKDLYQSKNGD